MKIRILIADDHAVVRRGLRELLSDEFPNASFGEAGNAAEALGLLRQDRWDIALVDITMPGRSGLDLLKDCRSRCPNMPVLVLSAHPEDQFAVRVLKAGASGYMTKETAPEELVKAIRRILGGGRYVSDSLAQTLAGSLDPGPEHPPHETLSDREYEVMRLIASGKTATEIAQELALSVKTISTYRARILEKMRLRNNAEITTYAIRNRLVN